ncbi:MAG: hypothetical protein ACTHMH_01370, partial [Curtobacterium sp.]
DAPTAAAPMTESIPVITATIALALVAAAQEHADHQDRPDRAQVRADRAQDRADRAQDRADLQTHTDQPDRADATSA